MLAVVLLGVAAIAAAAAWILLYRPRSASPGPIVLISLDTLRADHLPAYGYRGVKTPAIDALAADGVIFEHAYAHSPQTLPSHTAILSGQLPFEHGVRDNVGFVVAPGQRLVQQRLLRAGWATAGFASSFILRKQTGIGQGFEVYDDETPPVSPNDSFSTARRDGAETLGLAERWLARQESPRFFLFVHFYDAHRPYRPPARYAHYDSPYDGAIAYLDELVGRLVADLKARDLYRSATIVLLSDHGEGLGDHGEQEHGVFLYDSTIRVPLVVKLPGGRDAGRRVGERVQHIDVVPTLLELAGLEAPRDLRGRSLRAAMDGSGASIADRGIYSETLYPLYHFGWSPLYALTDPRYRFIRAPRSELYDLQHDHGELKNLAAARPETAGSMRSALDRLAGGRRVDRPQSVSRDDLERLEALGYIGAAHVPASAAESSLADPKDKIEALDDYRQGIELKGQGRLREAADAFRRVLASNPSMTDVWAQLAAVLTSQGSTEEAVGALEHAVQLDPNLADNQVTLASAEIDLGRLDAAAEHARRALSDKPGTAHELLARIALARGDEAGALAEAHLAEQADPGLAYPAFVEGAALAKAGKYDEALASLRRAETGLQAHGARMRGVHLTAADALAHLGRSSEAEVEFKQELAAFPSDAGARLGLAMLYGAEGRGSDATAVLDDLLRAVPTPASYAKVTRVLQVIGRPDDARRVLERGLRRFPDSRELRAVGTSGSR